MQRRRPKSLSRSAQHLAFSSLPLALPARLKSRKMKRRARPPPSRPPRPRYNRHLRSVVDAAVDMAAVRAWLSAPTGVVVVLAAEAISQRIPWARAATSLAVVATPELVPATLTVTGAT